MKRICKNIIPEPKTMYVGFPGDPPKVPPKISKVYFVDFVNRKLTSIVTIDNVNIELVDIE